MAFKLPWISRKLYLEQAAQLQTAQDSCRHLQYQVEELRGQLVETQRDALESRSMVADWLAQQVFGRKVFGTDTPEISNEAPAAEQWAKLGGRRRTARDVAAEQTQQFFQNMAAAETARLTQT